MREFLDTSVLVAAFLGDHPHHDPSAKVFAAAGGLVYDALLLRCALKSRAEAIYTWNTKHFRRLSPESAARIRTP